MRTARTAERARANPVRPRTLLDEPDAVPSAAEPGAEPTPLPPRPAVAIVGLGPRGLSVFERLIVHLRSRSDLPMRVHLIEDAHLGGGRIWQPDQERWFLMNTVVGELTLFSGAAGPGPCRAGAGRSFLEWLRHQDDPELAALGPDDYAPRYAYGRYLGHVHRSVLASAPPSVEVVEHRGRVVALHRDDPGYRLEVRIDGAVRELDFDAVVLATGHGRSEPTGAERRLAEFAARSPGLRYIRGDNPGELGLDSIPPGAQVGLMGLGLSFYDVLLSLTIGRGGRFHREDGELGYRPSSREPVVVAGSRSGMPIAARAVNQKSGRGPFQPKFLHHEAINELRMRACGRHGRADLDFDRDVLPLLVAEINHVYYATHARGRFGTTAALRLSADLCAAGAAVQRWPGIAAAHGLGDIAPLDPDRLARPFATTTYTGPEEFRAAVRAAVQADRAEAALGNVDSPLKAATDVFRDARELIRAVVEFGGLRPESYRDSFLGRFFPALALLSTGPPGIRAEQFLALLDAGVLAVVGPGATFLPDPEQGRFVVGSPQVPGSQRAVSVLIDAKIPKPDLRRNADPLFRRLVADGIATGFATGAGTTAHDTGGIAITAAEYRVIAGDGEPNRALYAVGIPTEGPRWFTQIGNGRPGAPTAFERDAEVVAVSLLRRLGALPTGRRTPAPADRPAN